METQTSFPQLRHKRNCENEARTHTHTNASTMETQVLFSSFMPNRLNNNIEIVSKL